MLVYRTIAQKVIWEFDAIIMQNSSDILPLFCTGTWPSHQVSENKELFNFILFFYFNMPVTFRDVLFCSTQELYNIFQNEE